MPLRNQKKKTNPKFEINIWSELFPPRVCALYVLAFYCRNVSAHDALCTDAYTHAVIVSTHSSVPTHRIVVVGKVLSAPFVHRHYVVVARSTTLAPLAFATEH